MSATWPWSFPQPTTPPPAGAGKWWGHLLRKNVSTNVEQHPFQCAFPGCPHEYSKTAANATRVRNHVCGGTGKGIAKCRKATVADRKEAASHATEAPVAVVTAPSSNYAAASALVLSSAQPSAAAASSSAAPSAGLELTPKRRKLLEAVEAETMRNAAMRGLFRHMLSVEKTAELHKLWARAIANAGLPPNILENDYVRDAIFRTSLAPAPYQAPRRNLMERKLLPAYDKELSMEVKDVMKDCICRVLGFDGWDDAQLNPLLNFMLFSEKGDEFIDNENMTGKDKDGSALAKLAFKYIKWTHD